MHCLMSFSCVCDANVYYCSANLLYVLFIRTFIVVRYGQQKKTVNSNRKNGHSGISNIKLM